MRSREVGSSRSIAVPDPVTIVMTDTAKVVNTSAVVVLDGGGKVTLSGDGQRRILYMNTCDQAQIWTTSHCQNQDQPELTIQGLTFTQGNSTGDLVEGGGGGAVFVRGGRVKVIDSFVHRQPMRLDRARSGWRRVACAQPVQRPASDRLRPARSGESGIGNVCSNGAAISSIGVSWQIYNSVFTRNSADRERRQPVPSRFARRR